jgi:putative endonuclease
MTGSGISSGTESGNRPLGLAGEQTALSFFVNKGYRLLEKNFRVPCGEIDLILEKGREIVFVEVKARRSTRYGLPEEAVITAKQRRIIRAALWYVQKRGLEGLEMRFDVLAVLFHANGDYIINHIPWAFDATDTGLY